VLSQEVVMKLSGEAGLNYILLIVSLGGSEMIFQAILYFKNDAILS
jgi:hypothetical protein